MAKTARSASISTLTAAGVGSTEVQYLNAPAATLTFSAPTGLDTFAIKTYDEQNGQGNVLSEADVTQTVSSSTANVVAATLNGVIASLKAGITYPSGKTSFVNGTAATATVTVTAYDTDGNAILEPTGSSDYDTPIHISVAKTLSTDTGTLTLGSNLLQSTTATGSSTTLAYNGGLLTPSSDAATITASATGVSSATAPVVVSSATGIDIFVVEQSGSTLGTFLPNGSASTPIIAGLSGAVGIAVDQNGKCYVANSGANSLTTYLPNGTQTTPTITGLENPQGVAVDGNGKIYIADYYYNGQYGGAILTFNSNGAPTTPTITTDVSSPSGVAVDGAGKIYVTNKGTGTVTTYLPSGTQTTPLITGLSQPSDVTVDSTGKIYVVAANGIFTFNSDGTPTTPSITAGLDGQQEISVDVNGKIYVTNSGNGTVTTYLPNGTQTTPTITGLSSPTGIAVSAF